MKRNLKILKYRIGVWLLLAMLFSGPSIVAQEQVVGDTTAWDLNHCISYALENNIQVSSQKLSELTMQADLLRSKSERLPTLSASVTDNLSNSKDLTNNAKWSSTNAISGGINTSMTLYNGGSINAGIAQSKLQVDIAKLSTVQAKNNITLSITQAYLSVLYAKESYDYAKDVLISSEQQLKQSQQYFAAGKIAKTDLIQMQSQYATDQYSSVTAQNTLILQTTVLKQLLEIPVIDTFKVYFPNAEKLSVVAPLPVKQDAFDMALKAMPEIKSSQLQNKVSELGLNIARAGYLPSLSLNGSVSTDYSNYSTKAFTGQLSDNQFQKIGLTLSIPIFSQNAVRTSVQKSQINIKQSELNSRTTEKNLLQEVETAYQNVVTGQMRYTAAKVQLEAAQESYNLSMQQFNLGMLSAIDLLNLKNKLLNADSQLIQSKYSLILNQKVLDFYMGNPISL
jgi:Outer membrane protein